jgi:hypothetical protein
VLRDGDEIGLDWIVSLVWVWAFGRLWGGWSVLAWTSKRELEQMRDDDRGHENQSEAVGTDRGRGNLDRSNYQLSAKDALKRVSQHGYVR